MIVVATTKGPLSELCMHEEPVCELSTGSLGMQGNADFAYLTSSRYITTEKVSVLRLFASNRVRVAGRPRNNRPPFVFSLTDASSHCHSLWKMDGK
jgi:hypothetical protein